MKWLPFAILAALCIVCQTTVVRQTMTVRSTWPEWTFVLAVHYALWGPRPDAAIAAWIVGLTVDLASLDLAPVHAFAYGAAAWGIIRIRHVLFRDHPGTHLIVTFVFALGVQLVVGIYRAWRLAGAEGGTIWGPALAFALYTALWAPPLLWALQKLNRATGLGQDRRFAGR